MLSKLSSQKYDVFSLDELPIRRLSSSEKNYVENAKPSDTGGLAHCLTLKVGAHVMISLNVDIEDKLVNG